jgi:hypothetical protein
MAIEDRKLSMAQRLKSLNNFSWSSLPMRYFSEAADERLEHKNGGRVHPAVEAVSVQGRAWPPRPSC